MLPMLIHSLHTCTRNVIAYQNNDCNMRKEDAVVRQTMSIKTQTCSKDWSILSNKKGTCAGG